MKTTVIKYLIVFLLLASLPGLAQFGQKPKAPVLPFRIDNTNSLNFLISSAGKPVVPTSTLSIWAEIRLYDAAPDTVRTVKLTRPANSTLAVSGILPQMEPGRYSLNLLFRYTDGQGDFRSGVCYIDMIPPGSIIATPDASGLNVTLNQTTQVLDVKLDATPSAAIARTYADQVRADVQIVLAAVNSATGVAADATQARRSANRADSSATVSEANRIATLAYRNQTQVLRDSASIYRNQAGTSRTNALASENTTKGYRDATLTTYNSTTGVAAQVQNNATTVAGSTTLVQSLANQVQQDRNTVLTNTNATTAAAGRASTSEQNAAVSETNAGNSANQANNSRISAGNSQTAAAASAGIATDAASSLANSVLAITTLRGEATKAGAAIASKVIKRLSGSVSQLRYVIFGDSYASKLANYIYPQLKLTMGGSVGGVNAGSTGDAPGTLVSSGTGSVSDFSKWPINILSFPASASATFGVGGVNATFNKVTVYTIGTGSSWKPQVDGADVTGFTSVTNTASSDLNITSFTVALGVHSLAIQGLSGTTNVVGIGVENTTASGTYVVNVGQGGMELSSWVNLPGSKALANLVAMMADVKPDLFTIEMKEPYTSAYDGATGITRTLFNALKAASPATDFVLVGSTPAVAGQDDADAGLRGFSNSLRETALALGLYYYDLYSYFLGGTSPYAKLVALNWHGDGVHRALQADQFFAGTLMRDLGVDSYVNSSGNFQKFADDLWLNTRLTISRDYANPQGRMEVDATFRTDLYLTGKRWWQLRNSTPATFGQFDMTGGANGFFPNNYSVGATGPRLTANNSSQLSIRLNSPISQGGDIQARNAQKSVATANSVSGVLTLDFSTAGRYNVTLTENITSIVVTNPPGNTEGAVVRFIQDATGGRTVSGWPNSFRFEGGVAPTVTTTPAKSDVYRFFFDNTAGAYLQDGKPSVGL